MPKISTYSAMSALAGTEVFVGNQSGTTKLGTPAQVLTYALATGGDFAAAVGFPTGTAAAPGLRGTSFTTTGLYLAAGPTLGITVGGVSAATFVGTSLNVVAAIGAGTTLTSGTGVIAGTSVVAGTSVTAHNATAIPAGGTAGAGVMVSSTTNFGVFFGSGAPSLAAAKGSLYLRSDGSGVANRAYINTDGSTAWTAVATAG